MPRTIEAKDATEQIEADTKVEAFGETVATDNFEGIFERKTPAKGNLKGENGIISHRTMFRIDVFGNFIVGVVNATLQIFNTNGDRFKLAAGNVEGHGTVDVGNRTLEYLIVGDRVIIQNVETGEMIDSNSVTIDGYKVKAGVKTFTVEPRRPIA